MYGYIRPLKAELKVREFEQYHAMYCTLCRALGKRYGLHARFLVSYDLTFLSCLLASAQPQWETDRCVCPAHPWCRQDCVASCDAAAYAADLNVLLSWLKLRDAAADERGLKRCAARLGMLLFRRAYGKAKDRRPQEESVFERQLAQLSALERERCASLDAPADAFAQMLAACAGYWTDPVQNRVAQQLLYHVGRFIYLTDAFEDLPSDAREARYNPIIERYQTTDLTEEQRRSLTETIDASISMAASALELLPMRTGEGILRNIIYLGMPGVLRAVRDGTFRNKKRADRSHL